MEKAKLAVINKAEDQDAAIEALLEAEELVTERKKKIRIVDGSKADWMTVSKLQKKGSAYLSADQQKSIKIAKQEALNELENRKRKRRNPNVYTETTPADRLLFRGTHIFGIILCYFSLHLRACKPTPHAV